MAEIFAVRFTACVDKPVALFLIGMRFNKLLAMHKWLPVTLAMPRMLAELAKRPDAGMLFARSYISGRIILVQQYWESFDKLLAYAHDRSGHHFPAWALSTVRSARMARSASGTEPIWSSPVRANASTSICRASVWRRRRSTLKQKAGSPPPKTA